jgi:hypothetical protein
MWICREDFGIERNQSPEKLSTVTHNSVFAAHRLLNAGFDLTSTSGIFLSRKSESGNQERRKGVEAAVLHASTTQLLNSFEFVYFPNHQPI